MGGARLARLGACTCGGPALALRNAGVEVVWPILGWTLEPAGVAAERRSRSALGLSVIDPCATTAHGVELDVRLHALAVALRERADRVTRPLFAGATLTLEATSMLRVAAQRAGLGRGYWSSRAVDKLDA